MSTRMIEAGNENLPYVEVSMVLLEEAGHEDRIFEAYLARESRELIALMMCMEFRPCPKSSPFRLRQRYLSERRADVKWLEYAANCAVICEKAWMRGRASQLGCFESG